QALQEVLGTKRHMSTAYHPETDGQKKIIQINERLKTARSRQKSYADKRQPIEIVERDVKKLKRRRILLVKLRWNSRQGVEYTWEREDQFWKKYPHLLTEPVPSSSVTT
nr:putative reverse transcriptase domain-containing protein [Tanacetum cinerariifolium]